LFVRLPTEASEKLDRAAARLRMAKKDLVAGLVTRYLDPPATVGGQSMVGSYTFQPYEPPEVMNTEQAAQFLQIEETIVVELAEAGTLPGRKLGTAWRFSRDALVAWLSTPDKERKR
jgi:excisionase family DNA binding protein